jgi:hypothetical protein
MRVNLRKGDVVRDTLELGPYGQERKMGLVVGVKGRVAEVYYPDYSGYVWLPFDILERVEMSEQKVNDLMFGGV